MTTDNDSYFAAITMSSTPSDATTTRSIEMMPKRVDEQAWEKSRIEMWL
jgi:hypothetical protein